VEAPAKKAVGQTLTCLKPHPLCQGVVFRARHRFPYMPTVAAVA
jgi:hypothetical protein